MSFAEQFILLTVDEPRADELIDDSDEFDIAYAVDVFAQMVRERDFSRADTLSMAYGIDQYGEQYSAIKVVPNVAFEYEGDVYAGSDGFLINMSNTLDYIKRRLAKLRADG